MIVNVRATASNSAFAKNDKQEDTADQALDNSHGNNPNSNSQSPVNPPDNPSQNTPPNSSSDNNVNGNSLNENQRNDSSNGNKPSEPPGQEQSKEARSQNSNASDHADKITICHVPPGNPSKAHAITISRNGWEQGHESHRAHADDFVVDGNRPCPPGSNGSNPTPTPTPTGNNGTGGGGSSTTNITNSGVGGVVLSAQETQLKQGEVLGAKVLAGTGNASRQFSVALQALGLGITLLWSLLSGMTKLIHAST